MQTFVTSWQNNDKLYYRIRSITREMNNGNGETRKTVRELTKDLTTVQAEMKAMSSIHGRLDSAIDKLTDVSSDLKSMLAVHEEKISKTENADEQLANLIEVRRQEMVEDLKELHSRINSQSKELREAIQTINVTLDKRVGILEKWRWLIIGGAILATFLINRMWFDF